MTVYIDVFFIVNLCADFIILSISRSKTCILKRLLGACFGAAYACLYFFQSAKILFILPMKIFSLFVMCFIVIFPCSINRLLEYFFQVLISSCFVCGIFYCLESLCGVSVTVPISELFLVIALSTGYIITVFASKYFKRKSVADEHKITIYYNNKSTTVYGICDTGNSLTDPISGFPVIICDISVLRLLICAQVTPLNLNEFVQPERFKVIPYKSVSSSGIMYGFIPDKIIIGQTEITNVIIAPAHETLGEQILINPLIIKD